MSKELIEAVAAEMNRLGYGYHESHAESIVLAMAKAAPVGELRQEFEKKYPAAKTLVFCAGRYDAKTDSSQWKHAVCAAINQSWDDYQAGAAYQRAKQSQSAEAVSAQVRFRRPEKGMPGWSVWQQTSIKPNMPAWSIDSAGYEVEYRLLYTAPQPSAGVVMPEGYALVPQRMHLSEEAIESITVHCGDGQDDAGYGPYQGGVLWIGEIEEEDGTKTYGLHIATADYPEAGSTTLVEFARLNGKEVGRG